MKLKFQKEDLNKALQTIQKVASNKSNNLYAVSYTHLTLPTIA